MSIRRLSLSAVDKGQVRLSSRQRTYQDQRLDGVSVAAALSGWKPRDEVEWLWATGFAQLRTWVGCN